MTVGGAPGDAGESARDDRPVPPAPHSAVPPHERPPSRALIISLAVFAFLVVVGGITAVAVALNAGMSNGATPPHPSMPLLVPSDTAAAGAAAGTGEDADAAAYLAAQPTAVWLTPEEHGIDDIRATVAAVLDDARAAEAAPVFVVYGLPERDCGQFSAGGLQPAEYATWTSEIGLALQAAPDVTSIVILEPDSLALAPECGNVADRVAQLHAAIDDLTAENTWIYLDGGHSNWLPAADMADLLRQAGVERVRGFATNVSNYNALSDEVAYAHRLSAMLDGSHAVIDTSRNGAGSDGQWCNPPGRLIGQTGGATGDDVVDLNLWIKPPGESDGTCNGGPAAGEWWPRSAMELTRDAVR